MKKIFMAMIALALVTSCNQQNKSTEKENEQKTAELTVEKILASPADFENQEIEIEGMVTHVCKHGGQKLFIVGTDPEQQLRINVGNGIPEFDVALEGSTVKFTGIVKILDETETEGMIEQTEAEEHHSGDEAHAAAESASYYVEAISFEEKESAGI